MKPRIFYYAYDHQRPNGGQKDTYQHVDVLNRAGFRAYVLHRDPDFRLGWFENSTPVTDDAAFRREHQPERDIVVLPEDLGAHTATYPGKQVIFNKNLYHGFRAIAQAGGYDPHSAKNVVGIFAVSEHNRKHLEFAYPDKPVHLVTYDLRIEHFRYRSLGEKLPVIAAVPKAMPHLLALQRLLQARAEASRNRLREFEWVVLQNMPEHAVAAVLERALLLVFLSVEEGLPRTPLEAMASGCLVTAYAHGPMTEYLPAQYGFAHGDLHSMAQFIEDATDRFPRLGNLHSVTTRAREIAGQYSAEAQSRSVLEAWERILRATSHGRRAYACAG